MTIFFLFHSLYCYANWKEGKNMLRSIKLLFYVDMTNKEVGFAVIRLWLGWQASVIFWGFAEQGMYLCRMQSVWSELIKLEDLLRWIRCEIEQFAICWVYFMNIVSHVRQSSLDHDHWSVCCKSGPLACDRMLLSVFLFWALLCCLKVFNVKECFCDRF